MGVVENVQRVADLVRKFNDIELNRRILELETEVLDLTRDKRRGDERVEELERALRFKEQLAFREPFYWIERDSTPFCAKCWEHERIAVHVQYSHAVNAQQFWDCPNCKFRFKSRGVPGRI